MGTRGQSAVPKRIQLSRPSRTACYMTVGGTAQAHTAREHVGSFFFPRYPIYYPRSYLSLPPSRKSDPWSHSRLFSPPTHCISCLAFFSREYFSSFFPRRLASNHCRGKIGRSGRCWSRCAKGQIRQYQPRNEGCRAAPPPPKRRLPKAYNPTRHVG